MLVSHFAPTFIASFEVYSPDYLKILLENLMASLYKQGLECDTKATKLYFDIPTSIEDKKDKQLPIKQNDHDTSCNYIHKSL